MSTVGRYTSAICWLILTGKGWAMIELFITCGRLLFLFVFICMMVAMVAYVLVDLFNFIHRKIITRRRVAIIKDISVDQWLTLSPDKLTSNCERDNMITCKWPITTKVKGEVSLVVEVMEIDYGYDVDYLLNVRGGGHALGDTTMLYMHMEVDKLPNLQDALRLTTL